MTTYQAGKWKAQCDRCGFDFLNTQISKEWTGLRVCHDCLDPRHPQERLRGKADRQSTPWSRPETDGPDVSPGSGNEVTSEGL